MLYYLLWTGVAVVVLLVLRMWQPELIYSFRKLLVNVRTTKAFLSAESGASAGDSTFSELLVKDLRYETRVDDVTYALKRSMKLRELYQMLDLRREDVPGLPPHRRKPQVCIVELSNLLENLARKMKPDVEYNYPTLGANTLLAFIGNELMKISAASADAADGTEQGGREPEGGPEMRARRAELGELIASIRAVMAGAQPDRAEVEGKLKLLEAGLDMLIEQHPNVRPSPPAGEATDGKLLWTEVQTANWFTNNPMSIEQIIEIMIAAVNGLAYRQYAQVQDEKRVVAGSFFVFNKKKRSASAEGEPARRLGERALPGPTMG